MPPPPRRPLARRFFARDTLTVARELVGCTLWTVVRGRVCAGRIVEVEAYLGERDPASHAGRGPTPRSGIMFGPPGVAYVYLSYGVHHCLNAVTEPEGRAGAVLLRALEPLVGLAAMGERRGRGPDALVCAGPGRLCRALGIDLAWNGLPLAGRLESAANNPAGRRVWIAAGRAPGRLAAGPRIGIRRAVEAPYRFCDPDSPSLSRPPGPGIL
ncbi:MAG TPA: DNA-3-methyladenine glycosylase [Candidatus Krumholzibacteria bacterium]|nr:DNA-3-methyladenine glycosylase [Candidatus Krumholzibacteria bacterium]HPD72153.1 DNA-3-methyladenine glycosylase [Candidatus Krumholzibacteria bacterium]HRY40915.1 DNA-3-methyladenine glycosylase [Candidatus Krumholzibacteria bacterium]